MNPLGDETGLLLLFGVCTAVVLGIGLRLRTRRRPILTTAVAGLLCGLGLYALIAAVHLLTQGTGGYRPATWLVLVGAGLVPAGGVGLVEGLAAGVIIRLMG